MNRFLLIALLGLIGINLFSWTEAPIEQNDRPFDVTELLISENWQEAAPIFLAENFENLAVTNVGSEQELGFSFQRELVSGYGEFEVNRDAPIDLRDLPSESLELIKLNSKYEIEPFCDVNEDGKYCDLVISWDQDVSETAVFIGVRIGETEFALIEQKLLEKIQ